MTVTINYTAFLLTIVGGVAIAALVYFIIVLTKISRAIGRLDATIDRADDLIGSLKALADESTATVISARTLVDEGHRVIGDFSVVSGRMRELAESDASRALSLIDRVKSFMAIFAGIRTAFDSVKYYMERRRAAAGTTDN